ncbi:MAG TPA: tagaturonate epimerase family protein [Bacteroidales bacterium]|nr:tagaturonate epimerase family protein [Bacteroidales bacterium]
MQLGTYSMGIGDRFGLQGKAQLRALQMAAREGITITPVWNKSNREHELVHSEPIDTRLAAEEAVRETGWGTPWFLDADHISRANVDRFIEHCNFFTLDVSDYIGRKAPEEDTKRFLRTNAPLVDSKSSPDLPDLTEGLLQTVAEKYLYAVMEAAALYTYIHAHKKDFICEVSMDETDTPQTPGELFLILKALSDYGVPVNTIAPKFSGRFNKGVDYIGDIEYFAQEFEQDLLVVREAKKQFSLPPDLKISIHSGSDKFSLYPVIGRLIRKYDEGIHLKTAGTTWLEELAGLALGNEDGLELAKRIYIKALDRVDELIQPYRTVIDIKREHLPPAEKVYHWSGEEFAAALRHEPRNPSFNPDFRQLLHVAYKIAAEYSNIYTQNVRANEKVIGELVTDNLYNKHIRKLFLNK